MKVWRSKLSVTRRAKSESRGLKSGMADILRRKQTPLIGIPEWLVHQRNLEFQSRISNTVARPNLNSEKAKKIGIGNRRMPYGGEQPYIPYFADMTVFQPAGSSFLIKKDGARPAKETITIRDLMRHTSGLIYGVFDSGPLGKMYKEAEVTSHDIDLNEFSTRMSKLPLRFEPGTAWHYGRSTDVLGRVIEIASGQTLDKFLEARIFKPLGMTDTAFYHDADKADRIAQPVKPLFDPTFPR